MMKHKRIFYFSVYFYITHHVCVLRVLSTTRYVEYLPRCTRATRYTHKLINVYLPLNTCTTVVMYVTLKTLLSICGKVDTNTPFLRAIK